VRQFCQLDALGQRVTVRGWSQIAPLVRWPLEPAWDHVVLIGEYEVGSPRATESTALEVEVRYKVLGQVSALGLETEVHAETVAFRVDAPDETGWRIDGPPPPPHLFAGRVDVEHMRRSFEYGSWNFVPNSLLVWQLFRSAGWNVPLQRTVDLPHGAAFRSVPAPQVGDLVLYLRDGVPYHTGVLEAEDRVVSSTLHNGIVRTVVAAFPGEVKYLRLVEPAPAPAMTAPLPTRPARAATPRPVGATPAALSKQAAPSPRRRRVGLKRPATPPAKRTP